MEAFSQKEGIPSPLKTKMPTREFQHMDSCESCRNTWSLFWFSRHKSSSLETLTEDWVNLTEEERLQLWPLLVEEEHKWFQEWARIPAYSGYQMFVKQKRESSQPRQSSQNKEGLQKEMAALGQEWRAMSDLMKAPYHEKAQFHKQEKKTFLESLPRFIRIRYKQYCEEKKQEQSRKRRKQPVPMNNFHGFLRHEWLSRKSEEKEITYKQVMQEAGEKWKRMSDEEKAAFTPKRQALKKRTKKTREGFVHPCVSKSFLANQT